MCALFLSDPTCNVVGNYREGFIRMNTMTEAQFVSTFPLINTPDGDTVYDSPPAVDAHHVWTLVDGDDGGVLACAGWRVVNRIGYVVTAKAWNTGDEQAVWGDAPTATNHQ